MIMTNKRKSIIILSVFIILDIILGGVYWFELEVVESKTAEAFQAETSADNYSNKEGGIAVLQKKVKETSDLRAAFNAHFITTDDRVAFIEKVESLGAIASTSVKITDIRDVPDEYRLELDLTSVGSFGENMKLISLLENLPYRVVIEKVFFRQTGGGQDVDAQPQWEARFSLAIIGYLGS